MDTNATVTLKERLAGRVARYADRREDWSVFGSETALDPRYARAQRRYLGASGSTDPSDLRGSIPATAFTMSIQTMPAGNRIPVHCHETEEVFFIPRRRMPGALLGRRSELRHRARSVGPRLLAALPTTRGVQHWCRRMPGTDLACPGATVAAAICRPRIAQAAMGRGMSVAAGRCLRGCRLRAPGTRAGPIDQASHIPPSLASSTNSNQATLLKSVWGGADRGNKGAVKAWKDAVLHNAKSALPHLSGLRTRITGPKGRPYCSGAGRADRARDSRAARHRSFGRCAGSPGRSAGGRAARSSSGREIVSSRHPADADTAVLRHAEGCGRDRTHRLRPLAERVIEMRNSHCLAIDFEQVVIAVGIERIAAIVRGKRDRHAGCAKLVDQGDPTPTRCTPGIPALQIHVAHRQHDNCDPRFDAEPDRLRRKFFGLQRERAAMAALNQSLKIAAQRRRCHHVQHPRFCIAGFVNVQIERQGALLRQREKPVEVILKVRGYRPIGVPETGRHHAENPARIRHLVRQGNPGLIHEMVEGQIELACSAVRPTHASRRVRNTRHPMRACGQ